MAKYRHQLPFSKERKFLTDGGLETYMVFDEQQDLPCFASIVLVGNDKGEKLLRDYFDRYLPMALNKGAGFILESTTWRSNPQWAQQLGFSEEALGALNHRAIEFLMELREKYETPDTPIVISGCVGPKGDGYVVDGLMSADAAAAYHEPHIAILGDAGVDLVSALTLNYVEEAIGFVQAAKNQNIPAVVSFTVETDGRLPSGQSLQDAIEQTDAASDGYAEYFMVNCAHPTHFEGSLGTGKYIERIHGIRANASKCSHAELDEAEELDSGNPVELGTDYQRLQEMLPNLRVYGGCCGTDHRHVQAISDACL